MTQTTQIKQPQILICADHVFETETYLNMPARKVFPNTVSESNLQMQARGEEHEFVRRKVELREAAHDRQGNRCKVRLQCEEYNLCRQTYKAEKSRQVKQWTATACVVQGHIFDDIVEAESVTLIQYLNKHKVISFSQAYKLTEFWA